jgi:hypothetical protein
MRLVVLLCEKTSSPVSASETRNETVAVVITESERKDSKLAGWEFAPRHEKMKRSINVFLIFRKQVYSG